jgi:RNA polymerase primary sigma factor
MVRDNLSVTVERAVNGSILQRIPEVDPHDYVPEFCDALVKHRKGEVEEDLSEAGDVVRTEITHRVPAVDEEASGLEPFQSDLNARAELLVRLANDSDDHLVSRVAMFRGRQMVVKYWRRKNIVVGGRPFHAVLLAGEAVETGSSGDPQVAADQFLRMAEPPAHDDWKYNDEIRANFAWGAKARLDELFGDVTRALKKIVRPRKSDEQTDAPRELQRLLQISGGTAASSAAVTLRRVRGNVEDGQWHLEAEIHVKERAKAWDVTPALRIVPESGKHLHVPWEHFELIAPERGQAVMKGERTLRIEPRTRKVRFKATAVRKVEGVIAGFCKTKVELQITQASRDGGE